MDIYILERGEREREGRKIKDGRSVTRNSSSGNAKKTGPSPSCDINI